MASLPRGEGRAANWFNLAGGELAAGQDKLKTTTTMVD